MKMDLEDAVKTYSIFYIDYLNQKHEMEKLNNGCFKRV